MIFNNHPGKVPSQSMPKAITANTKFPPKAMAGTTSWLADENMVVTTRR